MKLSKCRRAPDAKRGCPPVTVERGDQGEQPFHPRGGGGTPSPLVGWAGGRWPVGAQSSFCTFAPELLQLQEVPDLDLHSDEQLVAVQVKPGTCSCNRCREKVHHGLGPSGSHCSSERLKKGPAVQRLFRWNLGSRKSPRRSYCTTGTLGWERG